MGRTHSREFNCEMGEKDLLRALPLLLGCGDLVRL